MALGDLRSGPEHDDVRRRALWSIPTVLAVLGTVDRDDSPHLMNISWVTPAANDPSRLVASIESKSKSAHLLAFRPSWALSLLGEASRSLGRAFVKPDLTHDRSDDGEFVDGERVQRSSSGAPYLAVAIAVLAGEATHLHDLGEHQLWLLRVDEVATTPEVLAGPAAQHAVRVLGVHDTRMNYGR